MFLENNASISDATGIQQPSPAATRSWKVLLQHPHQPGEISGVVTFVEILAAAFKKRGCEARIMATATADLREMRDAVAWADVVHLSSGSLKLTLLAKAFRRPVVQHYHFPFWGTWKVSPADRELGFWGCLGKSVAVPWGHGRGWRRTWNFAKYFGSSVLRIVARLACVALADRRIAVSEFIARDSRLPGGMHVVPNPVDFDALSKVQPGRSSALPRITFVGRVSEAKGPQLLIEAAHLLAREGSPVEVAIVGDGDLREPLEKRTRELGLEETSRFYGRVPREVAYQVMAGSTAVVVASQWDDPSPYTVLEASALKCVVIGSKRGGIPEIIGPGILLADDEPATLARAIRELLEDADRTRLHGERCYDFTRRRSHPDAVCDALCAHYQTLVGAI